MIDRLPFSNLPRLATERLSLRRPEARDAEAIVAAVGEWEVARCLARVPYPYGPADAEFFLEHVVPNEWVWAITSHGSDTLLGAVGLTPEGADTVELGYWLSRPCWGRGLMTEAAGAVAAFGLGTLRFPVIASAYFEANPTSGRVLEKLGFVETGRSLRSCLAAGSEEPSIEMHLLPKRQPD